MSTLPLCEKYRPKMLSEIVGQHRVVSTLREMLKDKTLPHMLFVGPPGCGKTSTAWAIANELYGGNARACCLELNASDERGINTIRGTIKTFARTGGLIKVPFKMIILDEADNMTTDAQEALRRIMEEYVENVRFILCANNATKIIPAILSRCTPISFMPLTKASVVSRLRAICESEGITADNRILETIYELSGGDLRRAINILEAAWKADRILGEIREETIAALFGAPSRDLVKQMMDFAFQGNFSESCRLLDELLNKRFTDGKQLIYSILDYLKSMNTPQSLCCIQKLGELNLYEERKALEVQLTAFLAYVSSISYSVSEIFG